MMFSGVAFAAAFDWDSERINYESVRKHFDELELVKRLRIETIYCDKCQERRVIDCKLDGVVYCSCSNQNTKIIADNCWRPYMERQEMIVWRREERPGLFSYKGIVAKGPSVYVYNIILSYHEIQHCSVRRL